MLPWRPVVEVAVFGTRLAQRVGRFVVGAVPREREVHVFGNIAAQHRVEVVADIARVIALAARDEAVGVHLSASMLGVSE